jgi:large subunit ribosomal protein L22
MTTVKVDSKEVFAKAKYVRISPFKLRRIANIIRNKDLVRVIAILKSLPHKGAELILRVVNSAQANAVNNNKESKDNLVLKTIQINEGPRLKRFQPRARGRMYQIIKRNSHIIVGVEAKEGVK